MGRGSKHFLHEASRVYPQAKVTNHYKEEYDRLLDQYDPSQTVDNAFIFNTWQV